MFIARFILRCAVLLRGFGCRTLAQSLIMIGMPVEKIIITEVFTSIAVLVLFTFNTTIGLFGDICK